MISFTCNCRASVADAIRPCARKTSWARWPSRSTSVTRPLPATTPGSRRARSSTEGGSRCDACIRRQYTRDIPTASTRSNAAGMSTGSSSASRACVRSKAAQLTVASSVAIAVSSMPIQLRSCPIPTRTKTRMQRSIEPAIGRPSENAINALTALQIPTAPRNRVNQVLAPNSRVSGSTLRNSSHALLYFSSIDRSLLPSDSVNGSDDDQLTTCLDREAGDRSPPDFC